MRWSRQACNRWFGVAVPGEFLPGSNYLAFDRPEQCVERVQELMANEPLAYQMKVNNYGYYHGFVRPDRLVLNSRIVAIRDTPGPLSGDALSGVSGAGW